MEVLRKHLSLYIVMVFRENTLKHFIMIPQTILCVPWVHIFSTIGITSHNNQLELYCSLSTYCKLLAGFQFEYSHFFKIYSSPILHLLNESRLSNTKFRSNPSLKIFIIKPFFKHIIKRW